MFLFLLTPACLHADQIIYSDSLQNGWDNWSWASVNLATNAPVHAGSASIFVAATNYSALYLHHSAQDGSTFTNLVFYINGGSVGGQHVQVQATLGGTGQTAVALAPLPVNSWRKETISISSLGAGSALDFDGFWIQSTSGGGYPAFFVDDISLVSGSSGTGTGSTNITVTVNASADVHPISPLIYGTAFANSAADLASLNAPLHRSGGNAETRYNWQIDAHNRGADWYFESLADSSGTPAASTDGFIQQSKNGGAEPMITIPMIGWVPKLGPGRAHLASFQVSKYGAQQAVDPYWSDAGNGLTTGGQKIVNDPNDANFPTNSAFQAPYIEHLTSRWGTATNGGVRYYLMDNESTIWFATHRDVHPVGPTMREIRDKIFEYSSVVKSIDPNALVAGPEEWGWSGYLYSGYDQQNSGNGDRATNGGWDYLPWLLDQMRQHDATNSTRALDVFTVHYYPQGADFNNDSSSATQLLRNRSTRSLWDTNYVDASWINSVVKLIPRLRNWVATYYPGLKIGITEYNWGLENHINGATAQADILGIFGRENLDIATRWTTPAASTPTFKAMKIYRNYDGLKSGFGDTSVRATVPNPDNLSAFAAVRSQDGALTVMVINKMLSSAAAVNLSLTNFYSGPTASVWQLNASNTITHLPSLTLAGSGLSNLVSPQSITLFVIAPAAPPALRSIGLSASNTFDLWLDGTIGKRYALQVSEDLTNWLPLQTNLQTSTSLKLTPPASGSTAFYRARWVP